MDTLWSGTWAHSAKSVTDKHYVTPSEDEMQELFRTQVVARVEAALKRLGEKRQQNGKTRVSRPISASESNSRRP